MASIINLHTGESIKVPVQPKWENGAWLCGDVSFGDLHKTDYAAGPPAVGPIAFKLLFLITELAAIRQLIKTDPVIQEFMDIVNDPRTDVIDMSLESVQNGIGYVLSKIYTEPAQANLLGQRVMTVLSGTLD